MFSVSRLPSEPADYADDVETQHRMVLVQVVDEGGMSPIPKGLFQYWNGNLK
jgi:hypothetical protein